MSLLRVGRGTPDAIDRISQIIPPKHVAGALCASDGMDICRSRHFQMDVEMLGKQLIAPFVAISIVAAQAGCHGIRNDGPERTSKRSFRFHLHRFGPDTASLTPPAPDSSAHFGETVPPSSPASEADEQIDQPADAPLPTREEAATRLGQIGGRLIESDTGEVLGVDAVRTDLTDADLPDLVAFPELRELNLRETGVTDNGMTHLAELQNLEFLGLTGTRITDDGLHHLTRLTELRFLTLGNTKITDEGLETLAECPRLEAINLKATRVSPEGVAKLQNRLPLCRVITDSLNAPQTSTSLETPTDARPNGFVPYLPFDAPDSNSNPDDGSLQIPLPPHADSKLETPPAPRETQPDVSRNEIHSPAPAPMNVVAREVGWPDAPSHQFRLQPRTPLQIPHAVAKVNPEQRLMRLLREKLEDPDVLHAFAQVYADQGNWDDARRMLQAASRLSPQDVSLRYDLGVVCARCGDLDSAFEHFTATIGVARAHYNLGVLLHEQGRTIAATRQFREALRRDDSLTAARKWLAFIEQWEQIASTPDNGQFALSDEQLRRLFLPESTRANALQQASFGDQTPFGVKIQPQVGTEDGPLRR